MFVGRRHVQMWFENTTKAYLFLSLAKNVSGTQIFSAKSPESVSKSL